MIKTVIFDLGGVLVRTVDPRPRQQLAQKLGLTYDQLNNLVYGSNTAGLATTGKITAAEHKKAVLETLNLPADSFSEFGNQFWGGDRLDSELTTFIKGLQGDYTTALLSNAWDDLRPLLVNLWKIEGIFDHIFISAELGLAKPDPRIYHHVIEELNQDPAKLVFVDDFIENVLAAQQTGLNAVHFRDQEQALHELAEFLDNEL